MSRSWTRLRRHQLARVSLAFLVVPFAANLVLLGWLLVREAKRKEFVAYFLQHQVRNRRLGVGPR